MSKGLRLICCTGLNLMKSLVDNMNI
uniref:Uncharacterized protein n=1 Tax=Arundo donax TaxID=35708 RepID=A0A0A9BSG0_ARUDO